MINIRFFYFYLFLCNFPIASKHTLPGNNPNGFSFTLLKNISIDLINKKFFVLAGEKPSGANGALFGITLYTDNGTHIPLITPNAIVNNAFYENNPLYGTYFLYSTLAYAKSLSINPKSILLTVTQDNPDKIYGIYTLNPSIMFNTAMFLTPALTTSENNTGEIHAVAPRTSGFAVLVEAPGTSFGSGTPETTVYLYNMAEKTVHNTTFTSVIANASHQFTPTPDGSDFALSSGTINIIPDSIKLLSDHLFNTPFLIISGSGSNGICTILNGTQIIAQASAIENDSIIATTTPDQTISINLATIMTTSTGLNYLVIVGGLGESTATNNTVYAMPLVNNPSGAYCGFLANTNTHPTSTFFKSGLISIYQGTYFSSQATAPGDLYTTASLPARIGNGPLQANNDEPFIIQSIETHKDTVFVQGTYNGATEGVDGLFYSQALFDEYGAIQGWTPWQRKNITGTFSYQKYIPFTGSHIFMPDEEPHSIIQTNWTTSGPWDIKIDGKKIYKKGFCQGITACSYNHPAIGVDENNFKPSFAFYTGYNTIVLQQTSYNNDLIPATSTTPLFHSNNGTLQGFNETSPDYTALLCEGGTLNNAGALIASGLAYTDTDCWIVVGGTNGLFILVNPDGSGCGNDKLTTNFKGLTQTMSWKKIGHISNIKKIITQKDAIYVLTPFALYLIPINSSTQFAHPLSISTILITDHKLLKSPYGSFSDLAISHSCALLATSEGLYQTYSLNSVAQWQKIITPEGEDLPCISLFPISSSGNNNEWAYEENEKIITGNIMVLMGSISTHQAKLYRLICYNTFNELYQQNNAIKMLPNYYLEDRPTAYFDFLMDRIGIVGDGAAWYTHFINTTNITFNGSIELVTPFLRTGYNAIKNYSRTVFNTPTGGLCGPLCYIPGFGLWLTCLDNGIGGLQ